VPYVVTGGAQGIGRVIAERLAEDSYVVVLDVSSQLDWQHERVTLVSGDGRDPQAADQSTAPTRKPSPEPLGDH
jgi:NAD(P)-dependent dehydrogenase (short-subunit alcohol dehydrogenase family)